QLGIRLLARTTRKVALTDAGSLFYRRAQAALDELAMASEEAIAGAGNIRGKLRVAVPNTFGRLWVSPLFPRFCRKFPQVQLDVRFDDRYADLITEGFDVAIRVGALQNSSLISRRIAGRRSLLCAAPAYLARRGTPLSIDELAKHDCIGFTGHAFWPDWPLQKGARRKTIKPQGPLVTDNAEANLSAAIAGLGVVLTADWLAGSALRAGKLVEVLPGWSAGGEGGVYVVMPPGKLIPAKTRAFVDFVSDTFRSADDWSGDGAKKVRTRRKA
ncbi:MAG: LysR substrate-binding domain-containing protein, partial [Hyphomicrobium sp.]